MALCADSEPFTFTAALQTHFAVHNLATHARHVRILGLGGKWIFDYTPDPMHPRLDMEKEDYVTFGGDEDPCRPSSTPGCGFSDRCHELGLQMLLLQRV